MISSSESDGLLFLDFLVDVSDQLFKFANVFIVKARADLSEYFPTPLNPVSSTQPIVGYYLIPTEQTRILRDKYNRPKSYQQQTDPMTYSPTDRDPVWSGPGDGDHLPSIDVSLDYRFFGDRRAGRPLCAGADQGHPPG